MAVFRQLQRNSEAAALAGDKTQDQKEKLALALHQPPGSPGVGFTCHVSAVYPAGLPGSRAGTSVHNVYAIMV